MFALDAEEDADTMKILITGSAGFIGFHAAQAFLRRGWEVVGLDNFCDYYSVQLKHDL